MPPIDPLYAFVLAGLFTPGPNVILIAASGARFGVRPTVPHIAGVVVGVGITSALTALGIGAVLLAAPAAKLALQLAAAAWILWMAWSLLRARPGGAGDRHRPFTFVEAVLFQWVNPKVWAIALAASSGYASDLPAAWEAARIGSAFSGINLFVCIFWASAGALLSLLLTTPAAWRAFITVMAIALSLSAGLIFVG